MLKVNFDTGRDHIDMFLPFVMDGVASLECDDFVSDDVRNAVLLRHELTLPVNTLQVLLGRLARMGYLRREAGRYFKTDREIPSPDLRTERLRVETRHARLADALCEMASREEVELGSRDDALAVLLSFIEANHVDLAFNAVRMLDPDIETEAPIEPRQRVLAARFLHD